MFFVFVDKEKADRFMKTPWKFMDQILPDELPPVKVNIPLKNLPIVGYLEETLSSKINDGLRELSKYKPKYPYKNLSDSARLFFALYLKGLLLIFLILREQSIFKGLAEEKLQGQAGQI